MLSRERARASASRCATTRRPSDVILPGQGRFWLSSANALIAVDRDREATLTATRREKAAPRALIYISRKPKGVERSFGLPCSCETTPAVVHSITFEHRYLLRPAFPSRPPSRPISLSLLPALSSLQRETLTPRSSFSLPLSLSLSLSLPLSLSLSFLPLHARTPEARFKDRHANTFFLHECPLGRSCGHDRHDATASTHPSSSSAFPVSSSLSFLLARSHSFSLPLPFSWPSLPLSLSLVFSPPPSFVSPRTHSCSLSLAFSLAVPLAPAARPSSPNVERNRSGRENSRYVKRRSVSRSVACPCSVAREPTASWIRRRWYGGRAQCRIRVTWRRCAKRDREKGRERRRRRHRWQGVQHRAKACICRERER